MWRKTPYDDEFEEKRIEIEIHNAYEKGFNAGLQAQTEKTCDTCKHYNEFCETPMIKGCKLYEQAQIDNKFWELDDNDDCISRKAVLSILADHFDNPFDRVRELPPVAISYDGDLISRQDAIDAMTLSNINQNMDDLNDNIGQKVKRSAQRILAQLPTVAISLTDKCDDLISRQAVLDLIVANHTELNGLNVVMYSPLYKDIRQLPPVKPQEPTTKNDLGVDWDELKSKIFAEVDGGTDDSWLRYADVCDRISNSIDEYIADLPSVTPQEPKTGHWKRISMDKYTEHAKYWYECDKCGEHNLGDTDFCPSCGCRMVEPQEVRDKK